MIGELSGTDILALRALVSKAAVLPVVDGNYIIPIKNEIVHILKCAKAREDWQDYYRSVRTLRALRKSNQHAFKAMSKCWWKMALEKEYREEIAQRERVSNIVIAWKRAD